jgi:hypothetical protein
MCGQNWQSMCEQGGLQTWLSYTSSVRRNGTEFIQLIVGSLWKSTWNVWPKLNNLKAMLPNNWVYVNFWPTGNVMKEIKAEINHSTIILTFHRCQRWETEKEHDRERETDPSWHVDNSRGVHYVSRCEVLGNPSRQEISCRQRHCAVGNNPCVVVLLCVQVL